MPKKLRAKLAATCAVLVAASGLAAVATPTASATTQVYQCCNMVLIHQGLPWVVGPAHNITDSGADLSQSGCIGAIDVNGGNLSGDGYCLIGSGAWVHHPYCGCVLRDPAVYPPGPGTYGAIYQASESY